eukprot:4981450-Pleurochrysis_carterae.AAC.1
MLAAQGGPIGYLRSRLVIVGYKIGDQGTVYIRPLIATHRARRYLARSRRGRLRAGATARAARAVRSRRSARAVPLRSRSIVHI